jgi:hypothetical protein
LPEQLCLSSGIARQSIKQSASLGELLAALNKFNTYAERPEHFDNHGPVRVDSVPPLGPGVLPIDAKAPAESAVRHAQSRWYFARDLGWWLNRKLDFDLGTPGS